MMLILELIMSHENVPYRKTVSVVVGLHRPAGGSARPVQLAGDCDEKCDTRGAGDDEVVEERRGEQQHQERHPPPRRGLLLIPR